LGEQYLDGAVRRLGEELGLQTPLTKFASVFMRDQGARKFITLYLTTASSFTVGEPDHIESLRFEPIPEIQNRMDRSPEDFTETFRFLFRFYLSTLDLITTAT
jgi:hypothetical protein